MFVTWAIFSFSDIKRGYKIKTYKLHHKSLVKIKKTMLNQYRALFQLSFVQFRHYTTSFQGLLLSLTLMPKSKKTLGTRILRFRSRPPLRQGLRVLRRMWIIWKIGAVILSKRNMTEKDVCRAHMFRSLDCNFSFCKGFLHCWWLLKVKRRINKTLSK